MGAGRLSMHYVHVLRLPFYCLRAGIPAEVSLYQVRQGLKDGARMHRNYIECGHSKTICFGQQSAETGHPLNRRPMSGSGADRTFLSS